MAHRRARLFVLIGLLALVVAPLRAGAEGAAGSAARGEWGWSGLKLFASGGGFQIGRRSAGYVLQSGAALRLAEHLDLTAGYRLSGFSLGEGLESDLADVDERVGAPIVGLRFQF